jgi:hypothetical protein
MRQWGLLPKPPHLAMDCAPDRMLVSHAAVRLERAAVRQRHQRPPLACHSGEHIGCDGRAHDEGDQRYDCHGDARPLQPCAGRAAPSRVRVPYWSWSRSRR